MVVTYYNATHINLKSFRRCESETFEPAFVACLRIKLVHAVKGIDQIRCRRFILAMLPILIFMRIITVEFSKQRPPLMHMT